MVLPLATGGTLAHMLAVDYALKPVLNALKAQEVLHGVFADDSQIAHYDRTPEISDLLSGRLDDALATFTTPCNSAKRDWRRRYKEKRMKSVIRQFIALLLPGLLSVSAALHAAPQAPEAIRIGYQKAPSAWCWRRPIACWSSATLQRRFAGWSSPPGRRCLRRLTSAVSISAAPAIFRRFSLRRRAPTCSMSARSRQAESGSDSGAHRQQDQNGGRSERP